MSEDAALAAARDHGQFNIIHPASGLKIDVIVPESTIYNRGRFARTRCIRASDAHEVCFASPEDVIVKKLEYYLAGGSEKHLRDITGVLRISGEHIDHEYVSRWAAQIGAAGIWSELLRQCGPDAPPKTE